MSRLPKVFMATSALASGALSGVRELRQRMRYREAVPGSPKPPRIKVLERSTAEQVTTGLDLSGQNILVTGCNSGLGLETMRVLALRGAHVFGTARTRDQAEQACASVSGHATPLVIELTQFDTVMNAAEQFKSYDVPLHGLILNAGVMQLQKLKLSYGLEEQFLVNHLSHFLLVRELMSTLAKADAARVVTLSSRAYTWAPPSGIDFENLDGSRSYDPRTAYGQSKLANALFARELARRGYADGCYSNAVHPGVIEETKLNRHLPPPASEQSDTDRGYIIKTTQEGAATTCYVATHPNLQAVSGYYFSDCNWSIPSRQMQDDELAHRLWEFSERTVNEIIRR